MSPYLFVIAMEYLQREMNQLAMQKEFKFHPKCKKGDTQSVTIMQETFKRFSNASGLHASAEKNSIYTVGVAQHIKEQLIECRVQLIKSVLFGIQTYWAKIFLLPKKIMKMIETICRTFLCTGSTDYSRKALIACDRICQPKATGGLNVINMNIWNKAALLEHLWALAIKKDTLWIKWAHIYYIKNMPLDEVNTPKNSSMGGEEDHRGKG
uniref:Uncharacterized protein LOC104246441 n=1 Tax=Nicotiana sylvestris TaxID=4096 RepID=A0A1U7YP23_NICSY|nr:PREDICTED: uncharacterized protein LOC104246441 [Nicotiana sylvestris]